MQMDTATAARLYALGRVGMGVALLTAPERITRPWLGAAGTGPGARVMGSIIGVRDLVVGVGQLQGGRAARPWIAAGALCDAVDCAVTVRARDELPAFGVVACTVMAAGGAAAGAWLQSKV